MRILLILITALVLAAPAGSAELTVVITNILTEEGEMLVALYGPDDDFPGDTCHRCQTAPARLQSVEIKFLHLPAGEYAVSVYQDVNRNGKLDTGPFGAPTEPFGFSRNARGSFGPPSFDDAKFSVAEQPIAIEITLVSRPPAPPPTPPEI